MIVNGYAYPSIGEAVLEWWMPRINWLSCFSYGFTAQGRLINLQDEFIAEEARRAGVRPMMVLAPMDENGAFNSSVATSVLDDETARATLINEIEDNIRNKGMGGVDFDFEYLPGEYASAYVNLVGDTQRRLSPSGYITSVALAPKISSEQPGLLYEGHDYGGMGQAADYCLLMTYEWGYTYGEPMAVSPINNVRRVLEYGLSQIPAEKILMGLSNYGYDWQLPFVQGQSRAEKLSNYQAEARAEYYGVPVEFDYESMAPFFRYQAPSGAEHIVWFENEISWKSRLELVNELGLAGVSIWNIMSVFYGGI